MDAATTGFDHVTRSPHKGEELLGVKISAVDYTQAVAQIIAAAKEGRAFGVSALAVHGVTTGLQDLTHRYRLRHLDLVTPDGQPVRWGLNLLHGCGLKDRVYGPNLTLYTVEAAAKEGLPIYLYGTNEATLEKLQKAYVKRFPGLKIAGQTPSAFRTLSAEEVAERARTIRESGAKILLVGLGCPRQEVFAYEMREHLAMPMLAVGAAFDFHSGQAAQAPKWMQDSGLEWLYRLVHHPGRLWKRYLLLNPLYVGCLVAQKLGLRKFSGEKAIVPGEPIRYG